ncbi:plasmid stabilization system [Candidatus Moduliflexus flocculans]|uniref:Plasmid stabilization system n=1 Tax=Candidatus Moduliflexus flocculans TaxID=1499966 RepID=A0A0S6VU17_9BACT|nr:plasmid stabilization system [Candidatus Moduliflexus flocculans]
MSYQVTFTEIALKNLKTYPAKDQKLILQKIEQCAENPLNMPNVKKLVNFSPSYRLRAGNYRILFERDDVAKLIDVIDILPRREAYRRRD